MIKYFLFSIILLTGFFWGMGPIFRKKFCPICLGTVLTWIFGLTLFLIGKLSRDDALFVIVLMALSLGAVTEKFGSRLGIFWKIAMVILGAPALYFLANQQIGQSIVLGLVLALVTGISFLFPNKARVIEKDNFKNCC